MKINEIDRQEKNRMRASLEEIIRCQRELEQRVDELLAAETIESYRLFWQELKQHYADNRRSIHNYMVRKCNR